MIGHAALVSGVINLFIARVYVVWCIACYTLCFLSMYNLLGLCRTYCQLPT